MKVTIEAGSFVVEGAPPVDTTGMSEQDAETLTMMRAVVWANERLAAELAALVAAHHARHALATAMRRP